VTLFRSKAEQKLVEKGLDPARLPPGQYPTEKWPVLHAGTVPSTDLATWDFRVFGEVEEPITLGYDELQGLPQTEITIDIHCVTRWSRFDTSFNGVHWRELAKLVRPKPSAHFVLAHAEQGFTANVPLAAIEDDEALIAWKANAEPLAPEHGWPLRLVVPSRYFWKSAKWLRGLELLPSDQPGFWERYGYHNRLLERGALRLLDSRTVIDCSPQRGVPQGRGEYDEARVFASRRLGRGGSLCVHRFGGCQDHRPGVRPP